MSVLRVLCKQHGMIIWHQFVWPSAGTMLKYKLCSDKQRRYSSAETRLDMDKERPPRSAEELAQEALKFRDWF